MILSDQGDDDDDDDDEDVDDDDDDDDDNFLKWIKNNGNGLSLMELDSN